MIRLDDGVLLMRQLVQVVQVLIALQGGRGSSYVTGIIAQLLILLYQFDKKLPTWTMFRNNANVFNEEAGFQCSFALCAWGHHEAQVFTS